MLNRPARSKSGDTQSRPPAGRDSRTPGALHPYRAVRAGRPDAEAGLYYHQTLAYAQDDPDIYVLSNLNNVGAIEVNAFQVSSAAVLQKSIREGFPPPRPHGRWGG